jgi:hypothetical protein
MATSPSGETPSGVTIARFVSRNYINSKEWTTDADVYCVCFPLLRFADELNDQLAPLSQASKKKRHHAACTSGPC